ncbi:MAG: histidinol dehydrogenase [Saprospiraceae bacterium]|nr:histidinol dehydrogenase [Saprospiraceae bacterium]
MATFEIIRNPQVQDYKILTKRPEINYSEMSQLIIGIFDDVRLYGDAAVKKYTTLYDKVNLSEIEISYQDYEADIKSIPDELKSAIKTAYDNIYEFHKRQLSEIIEVETMPGVLCRQISVPIEKVGIYVPGGTAPLFSSILMQTIPAKLVGCDEIFMCTPPSKSGKIDPILIYCARLCGVDAVYAVGGAQAIAALTFGTESIKPVFKIFGPGNQYVNAAKQISINYGVAIDMPAGPSEVLIFADKTGIPSFIAADLLAQAEHGPDSQVVFVSLSDELSVSVISCIEEQITALPRANTAGQALQHSRFIVYDDEVAAFDFINAYAPEHLIIACEDSEKYIPFIKNAGSVFLGNFTPESAGDYASGTNHTLPTNGWAKSYSGLNVDAFSKKITFQQISEDGLKGLGQAIIQMAEAEKLQAHANAVKIRLKKL